MIPEIEIVCRDKKYFVNFVTVEQYVRYIDYMKKNTDASIATVMFFNKRILQDMFGNEVSLAEIGEIDAVDFLTAIKTIHRTMNDMITDKILKFVEVEYTEKEQSAFDDYDRENGYEDEQDEVDQWKACAEIIERIIRVSIRLLNNSYSQCLKENIVSLLEYVKFELDNQ